MKSFSFATLLAFTAFTTASAQAVTSLIVPGFDPQSLSADVVGVDTAAGQTTWAIQAGPGNDFEGTVTLVEGSNYASVFYAGSSPETTFTMAYGCTYQDGQAVCSGTEDGQLVTITDSAVDTPFAVGVGSTAAPGNPTSVAVTPAVSDSLTPAAAAPTSKPTSRVAATPSSSGSSNVPSPIQSSGASVMKTTWSGVLAIGFTFAVGFAIST